MGKVSSLTLLFCGPRVVRKKIVIAFSPEVLAMVRYTTIFRLHVELEISLWYKYEYHHIVVCVTSSRENVVVQEGMRSPVNYDSCGQ